MVGDNENSIITWLTAQRQMVSIWLDDAEGGSAKGDEHLLAKLEEHERWLIRSIDELSKHG